MTKQKFEKEFYDICCNHGIVVFFSDPSVTDKDNGYATWNEVHLGNKYSSIGIYMAVAFHEFGHAFINIKRSKNVKQYFVYSSFYEEYLAWVIGMKYYIKYFKKPFNKKQGNFLLHCLKTHATTDYDFKDVYGDEKPAVKKPNQ